MSDRTLLLQDLILEMNGLAEKRRSGLDLLTKRDKYLQDAGDIIRSQAVSATITDTDIPNRETVEI